MPRSVGKSSCQAVRARPDFRDCLLAHTGPNAYNLPAVPQFRQELLLPQHPDTQQDETVQVLLVEDNPVAASILQERLTARQAGAFDVQACGRLSAALDLLGLGTFDLVLLDLGLPDSDGLDTLRRLHERYPNVAVIVLTSLDEVARAAESTREGAQDYLVKGQASAELLRRAARYAIDSKRLEGERAVAERMRGIVEIAGAVCHELNQPLQVISGQAEMLQLDATEEDPHYKRAERIRSQVERMAKTISTLKNMTTYVTMDYAGGERIVDIDEAAGAPSQEGAEDGADQ